MTGGLHGGGGTAWQAGCAWQAGVHGRRDGN